MFAEFVEAGLVYKQLKPVPWSIANQTALADAELEYQDVDRPERLRRVPRRPRLHASSPRAPVGNADVLLVWTTTPWTLPANLAIAVQPEVRVRAGAIRAATARTASASSRTDLVERVFKGREGVTDSRSRRKR